VIYFFIVVTVHISRGDRNKYIKKGYHGSLTVKREKVLILGLNLFNSTHRLSLGPQIEQSLSSKRSTKETTTIKKSKR